MKILIIGWYGTETIGDRGILAGVIRSLINSYGVCEITIGSLHPFFTQRTLNEDYSYWKDLVGVDFNVDIFDSKNAKKLRNEILKSNLVVMGGGPLMHINPLYMVEYAFMYAKKINKKTAILGCGIGPIYNKKFHNTLINIIKSADLIILRDRKSLLQLRSVLENKKIKVEQDLNISVDPAVIPCLDFKRKNIEKFKPLNKTICVNLRSFPKGYSSQADADIINTKLKKFIGCVAESNPDKNVLLIPMHYFHVGEDDRVFMNEVAMTLENKNIFVQNENLTLEETLEVFASAKHNIGMRFHSVVFQTIVSGRNYVLDYTEPHKGKISGFLDMIDPLQFYKERYENLQDTREKIPSLELTDNEFNLDEDRLIDNISIYKSSLEKLQ